MQEADKNHDDISETSTHDKREEQDNGSKGKGPSKVKDLSHVPCKFFKVGSCTAGSSCPLSHDSKEPGKPRDVCLWFVKGNCRFGHKCALAHVLPGQSMAMDRKNKKAAQLAQRGQSNDRDEKADRGKGQKSTAVEVSGSRANTNPARISNLLGGSTPPTRDLQTGSRPPPPNSRAVPAPALKDADIATYDSSKTGETSSQNGSAPATSRSFDHDANVTPAPSSEHPASTGAPVSTAEESPAKVALLPLSTPSQPRRFTWRHGSSPSVGPIVSAPRSSPSNTTRVNGFFPASTAHVIKQYVVGARNALDTVLSNMELIRITLSNHSVSNDSYYIQVGFNEDLIHRGIGHLEEVYINVDQELSCSANMLMEIGKILSPLPCIISTATNTYHTPVFLDHHYIESSDFEDAVLTQTDRSRNGPVIECQCAHWLADRGRTTGDGNLHGEPTDDGGEGSLSSGKEPHQRGDGGNRNDDVRRNTRKQGNSDGEDKKEEKGDSDGNGDDDGGGSGDDPHSDCEQLLVPADFEVVAKIWVGSSMAPYQEFRIQTALFPKAQSKRSEKEFSTSQINFSELIFQIDRQRITNYEQTRAEVSVGVDGSHPAVQKHGPQNTPMNLINGMFLSPNGERTRTREDSVYSSRITFIREDRSCRWGFNVDDKHEREAGICMEEGHKNLPFVTFRHRPAGKPAATKAKIEVAAYWELPKPTKFWQRLVGGVPVVPPVYRNLRQVLEIELPMKFKSDKPPSTKLELHVRIPVALNSDSAQCNTEWLLRPEDVNVKVSSTIDQEQRTG